MLTFIQAGIVTATDCIRCTATIVVADDTPRIAINAQTRSPLRPDGTLTGPDDPDFGLGLVCPPCDAITMILADEIRLHKDDLITYFKVVFPHGRYNLLAQADAAKSTDRADDTQPSHPTTTTTTSLRELIEQAEPTTSTIEYAHHEARTALGATTANHIQWEPDERHDRLYGHLNHGHDSITLFYEHHDATSSHLFVSCPCPAEPSCPLGYDDAHEIGNLLSVIDGTATDDPRCPVHLTY